MHSLYTKGEEGSLYKLAIAHSDGIGKNIMVNHKGEYSEGYVSDLWVHLH